MNLIDEFSETMRRLRMKEVFTLADINEDFDRIVNKASILKLGVKPKKVTKVKSARKAIIQIVPELKEEFQFADVHNLVTERFHGRFTTVAVSMALIRMTRCGNFHRIRRGLLKINSVPMNEGN